MLVMWVFLHSCTRYQLMMFYTVHKRSNVHALAQYRSENSALVCSHRVLFLSFPPPPPSLSSFSTTRTHHTFSHTFMSTTEYVYQGTNIINEVCVHACVLCHHGFYLHLYMCMCVCSLDSYIYIYRNIYIYTYIYAYACIERRFLCRNGNIYAYIYIYIYM